MEQRNRADLRPALIGSGIIIGATLMLSAWGWLSIPEGTMVATHWGISGQADGYSSKASALISMPVVVLFLAGLFMLIARIEPRVLNLARSMKAYTTLCLSGLTIMLLLHAMIILIALGYKMDMSFVFPIVVGLVLIVTGNFMPKIRSNFFAGVRTPWTLSSELSWDKSNRLGGKLFILAGVITVLGALMRDMFMWTILLLSELILTGLLAMVYSYIVWRVDPNKNMGRQPEDAVERVENTPPNLGAANRFALVTYVLVVLLALGIFVAGQAMKPPVDTVSIARELVANLAKEDFAAAENDWDARMRQVLPPDRMDAVWHQTLAQYGDFKEQLSTSTQWRLPYTIVYVTCQFSKSRANIKVVFSHSGKVSGLWIAPAP